MLRIPTIILASAAALAATAAGAAVATGTVTAVDTGKHTVTLSDGMVYTATPTMDLTRVQVGYTLKVTFNMSGAANNVTALEILSPVQPSGY